MADTFGDFFVRGFEGSFIEDDLDGVADVVLGGAWLMLAFMLEFLEAFISNWFKDELEELTDEALENDLSSC
ncbi:hypothetical protein WICPIJ_006670 [Wickerhamomyces pijperi]|uniref:Uncharacterized protein n=1 Tax=Wickerhamomyces pijperi TaxID=599730 RepID=A0A9P8TL63_WICPI|nr:hypothetical protein WICPIJ_006670 [Wickerhamomyces pijperi]